MPALIIFRTEGSQSTGFVSCLFMLFLMVSVLPPGLMASDVKFMKMVVFGELILGKVSSIAASSFSCAGLMSSVWKAPAVFRTLACIAPAFSAFAFRMSIAPDVPPQEKPLGKSALAIEQTPSMPSSCAASAHNFSRTNFSRPATESMACFPICAASCMASPRSFTSFSPSSKEKTPALHKAVYSPSERPATKVGLSAALGLVWRSFSTPARPAMKRAGWQYRVSSSFSSGPLRQMSRMS
mmetsp:Transcript_125445/g.222302  ORF Transcript_125445/g.222302 Transcript_125445/m.222302 type:complete len:240 (-) Transcript_125445:491-1210(-)